MHLKGFLWIVLLALLWGPSALLIKVAVQDIPPITLVTVRVVVAAVLLYGFLRAQGAVLPAFGPVWKHFAMMGLLSNAVPYTLISWSEQYIDSALASMFIATTPIFTIVLAHLFIADDRLTRSKVLGVAVGFCGFIALLAPALLGGVHTTLWGTLAMCVMAASTGSAIVYGQQYLRGLPPLVGPTAQLTMASVFLLPLALLIDRPHTIPLPSLTAVAALLILATVCTALTFALYYRAMEITSAANLSMITYLVPIVGVFLGVVVLREQPGWHAYLGCGLIILGAMLVNEVVNPSGWRRLAWSEPRS